MEAHAENTRLLDLALGADRRAYSSCGSWANLANSWKEASQLGHGGVSRRRGGAAS